MRKFLTLYIGFILLSSFSAYASNAHRQNLDDNLKTKAISMNYIAPEPIIDDENPLLKWRENPLGIFVNYGLYSQAAGYWHGEVFDKAGSEMLGAYVHSDEYEDLFYEFQSSDFDAHKLASLASKSGMKRLIFTAKHHDGFCMFKTKTTEFNSYMAPLCRRDFVSELAEACRKNNVFFGLYYSLNDWHYPQAYGPSSHNANKITPEHFNYIKRQVTELLISYTAINEIWFDGGSLTFEQSRDLYFLIKSLQKKCLVSGLGWDFCDYSIIPDYIFPEIIPANDWQFIDKMNENTWAYRSWQHTIDKEVNIDRKLKKITKVLSSKGAYILDIPLNEFGSFILPDAQVAYELGDAVRRMRLIERENTNSVLPKVYKNTWLDRDNAELVYGYSVIDDYLSTQTEVAYKWNLQDFGLYKVDFEFTSRQIGEFVTLEIDGKSYDIELLPQKDRPVQAKIEFKHQQIARLPHRRNCEPWELLSYIDEKKPHFLTIQDPNGYYSFLPSRTSIVYERSILSDTNVKIPVNIVSADAFELWCNGKLIARMIQKNLGHTSDVLLLPLKEGMNKVVVKTYTREGGEINVCVGPARDTSLYSMSFIIPDKIYGFKHEVKLSRKDPATKFSDARLQDISLRFN